MKKITTQHFRHLYLSSLHAKSYVALNIQNYDFYFCPTEQKQNGDHITRNFTKISTTGNVNLGNDALFENSDSIQFREFMKTIPLTGDKDVDEEILNFYRLKFQN